MKKELKLVKKYFKIKFQNIKIARACKWVDEICENAPYDPTLELVDSLNCSHVAHGDDIVI